MRYHESIYISGEWVQAHGSDWIAVENPTTESVIANIRCSDAVDVDQAVTAAKAALPGWAATSRTERAAALRRLQAGLETRAAMMANTIVRDVGSPIRIAERIQAGLPQTVLGGIADILEEAEIEERIGNSLVLREPIGVVAAITPWNYPVHQVIAKVAPALAAGCTVVVKPSEVAPLSIYELFQAVHEAGLPAGVLNLVSGDGPTIGAALARHGDVAMISFTGSTAVGRQVAADGAGTVKRIALELGGKSANVLLEDADLESAVKVGIANAFLNAGQTCTAWSRMLVHDSQYERALALAADVAARYAPGDPLLPSTRLGPLVSRPQRDRVRGYIERGIEDGARLVHGGARAPADLERGYFVQPTVLADVDAKSEVAQQEIFGPVLSILRYTDEDDALRIANDSDYGLSGAVWSADPARAMSFARRMETGSVDINGAAYNPLAPFGGYKQSGLGREMGRYGLEKFQQIKAVQH